MIEAPEIICTECGWEGDCSEMHCSDKDFVSCSDSGDIKFNLCPSCGKADTIEDYVF